MRLAIHIFRKDVERLWPMVLVTFAVVAIFAVQDTVGGRQGTVLNLILPFAWCLLIALTIQQDALVGDRAFWLALPCGWRPVFVAKVAFIVAIVELPYFVATAGILLASGFNPLLSLPHLFWKQLVLLALILPAVAVAAVAKNIAQFLLILIAAVSGVVFFSDRVNQLNSMARPFAWDSRWVLALSILSCGALVTAAIQFVSRRTARARGIAIVTALIATGLYHWMSRDASAAVTAALLPAPGIEASIRITEDHPGPLFNNFPPDRTTAMIPIVFSGLPNDAVRYDMVNSTVTGPGGRKYTVTVRGMPGGSAQSQRIYASLDGLNFKGNAFLRVEFYNPAVTDALRGGLITVSGRMIVRVYRLGSPVEIGATSETTAREIGHCKSSTDEIPQRGYTVAAILDCESPDVDPENLAVSRAEFASSGMLLYPPSDRSFRRFSLYPNDPWLSPIQRGAAPFEDGRLSSAWKVTPATPTGYVLLDYTFPNLALKQYIVQDIVKPEAAQ